MNNIVAINGSPKLKDSASGMLIEQIETILGTPITTYQALKLLRAGDSSEAITETLNADALIFVFPLYVDSLPAPLIKFLDILERGNTNPRRKPRVYSVCNCGFYEAEHTRFALNIIENFCLHTGFAWGYGIGIGGGGFITSQGKNMSKGPAANVYATLCELSQTIQDGGADKKNVFVTAKIPRWLYKIGAHMVWRQTAKKNKVDNTLMAKPYEQ